MPNIYEIAKRNIDLNPDIKNKIIFKNQAVSCKKGTITISYDENDTGGASQYIKANNQVDVDTVTIESIIEEYGIKPHILKIDCEGCEVNIVRYSDLSMFHQIIMEYHTNVTSVNEDILIDILKNQGFELKSQVKFKNKGMGIVYMVNKMDAKNI